VGKNYRLGLLAELTLMFFSVAGAAMMEAGAAEMEAGAALLPLDGSSISPGVSVPPAPQYEIVEPEFVRALSSFESGRNDSNPVWAPTGKLIAFERSRGDKREIVISHTDGKLVQTIYFQLSGDEKDSKSTQFFMPGLAEDPSYNSGVSWARDSKRFAFMSNGGEGNYDIYSQILGGAAQRLTEHKEKDGLADWSPASNQVVFVSGRSGKGDVYLLDPESRAVTQLTWGDKPYLYPRWSPDGKKIAMIYGSTENHDIYVIDNPAKPVESMRALTGWTYDDLRPTWSPDGRKIAFYTNYNIAGEQKKWSLAVIAADGSDGLQGEKLEGQIVASDVVPDIEQGPAWLADGSGLVYVRDDALEYNPIFIVNVASRKSKQLKTETKMNHDISCGPNGLISFRAQQDQWDQIFIAKLPNLKNK
jgi:Tol biopolymer transport system component